MLSLVVLKNPLFLPEADEFKNFTNRKSYMGFRLVPKSVTLNDLERCNGHYFALFRGIG